MLQKVTRLVSVPTAEDGGAPEGEPALHSTQTNSGLHI